MGLHLGRWRRALVVVPCHCEAQFGHGQAAMIAHSP